VLNGGPDLGEDEWAQLRRHPVEGERLASGLLPWLGEWGRCVREHHERWDGSGYPRGLRGAGIPLEARIAAIADVFDALMSDRPYRPAMTVAEAAAVMREGRGRHFDPELLDAFLDTVDGA
jgi:putative two-component system response regulator